MANQKSYGLQRAVDLAGGKRKQLAEKLGCSPMTVTHWFNRGLPAERAKEIEEAFNGAITRQELRPDLFGPAPKSRARKSA